ncbi:MAG: dihydrolipoamide acetyltransferase family protein [Brooklawnia sp.]
MKQIKLPQWGMSMMEGTITAWLVKPGDEVAVGQELAEVESSKTSNTVDAMYAGTIGEILVEVGATVPVNTVLGTIVEPGETARAQPGTTTDEQPAAEPAPPAVVSPTNRQPDRSQIQAVPLARRMAREHGIDLAQVQGTGPRGRVVVADVEAHIEQAIGRPGASADVARPMPRMRQVIAERMVESLQTSAQLTLVSTADVTELIAGRADWTGTGRKPSITDAVVRACALALRRHPQVNSRIEGDQIIELGAVNIGVAVALDDGLVVPVIADADALGLAELAEVSTRLAEQARAGELGPDAYAGGTFTVTNLGAQGIDAFTPVLNLPEPAILGVGRTHEVLVRDGDSMAWRAEMTLSLTIDHRLIDGYPGALFLAEVVALLGDPGTL